MLSPRGVKTSRPSQHYRIIPFRWLFDGLQRRLSFGRGGCLGCGCGLILFLIFVALVCSILAGTDWFRLGMLAIHPIL